MNINHIGYAVKRIDRAIKALEELGFTFESIIEDTDRNVKISFGEKDGYRIELVSPLNKDRKSPVDQYISGMPGTPYHICYESANFNQEIDRLTQKGFKIIIEPRPAAAFGDRKVVFLMSLGFGLMEIVEV